MEDHVFGPVPSRRLGRSLGVDVVPYKTCTYDCIYCQIGRTTCKSIERKEWVPLGEILDELKGKLDSEPDYITLSGSGEPTLYSRIGELIEGIKAMTDVPVAVITNGSLLWQKEIRRQLMKANLLVPSLDAGDEAVFRSVNRPHHDIAFDKMLSGLIDMRYEFTGQYWLEVFLLVGYTATAAEVAKLVRCADQIKPHRVQLNTVSRPPAENFAVAASPEALAEFAAMFTPAAEIIAHFRGDKQGEKRSAKAEEVLNMLRRRPCSVDDIAEGLRTHRNEAVKYVQELTDRGLLLHSLVEGKTYYKVK